MLQWTGGSRRKVATSRKSTHNRQKQYFEQRKRRQQAPEPENNSDARYKRVNYYEEPRSLDILSLINVETVTWQEYPNKNNVIGAPQVNSHISKLSPAVVLKKIISRYSNDSQAACPEATTVSQKLPEANVSKNVPTTHTISSDLDEVKPPVCLSKSLPTNADTVRNDKTQTGGLCNLFGETSVLDLLSDDGLRNTSGGGGSVPEPHVAFSVEGLGKIGMQTPAHSPRFQDRISYRDFPSPPKASRWIHTLGEHKSVNGDLGMEMYTMINDTKMSQDGQSPESLNVSSVMIDELENMKSTKSRKSCVSTDFFSNQFDEFDSNEKVTCSFADYQREKQFDVSFGVLHENFLDEMKYEEIWKKELFDANGYPSLSPKAKGTEVNPGHPFPENFRTGRSTDKNFGFSGDFCKPAHKPAPLASDFRNIPAEIVCSTINKNSTFETSIDPQAWSFTGKEEMHDNISLFSEESCSSTAVGEERSYDFESQSIGMEQSNINGWEWFRIPSKNIDKFSDADLGRVWQKKNLVGSQRYKKVQNQRSPKSVWEPEFISSFKEGYSSMKEASDPSSCRKTSTELDTLSFNCKLKPEDDLFNLPTPKAYLSVELNHRRSKSNFPADHGPFNFCGDELGQLSGFDFQKQKLGKHLMEIEGYFQRHAQCTSLPKEHSAAKAFRTVEKPENDISMEKKSLSSENSITAVSERPKDNCVDSEHSENETQLNVPKIGSPCEEVKDVPAQAESCIDLKKDHSKCSSPVSSQVPSRDFKNEKDGVERADFRSDGAGNKDASYQVMLESYVLQLLCVQKVLMDSSKKDIKKV
ncbi:hypothetical protein J5N97_013865 [Dioscorea zingiberensis]|uniref:Uncharacterized protein n=1 Tax=Dioscorea zingiberensis TaxID=325984 RepID=A0A9D5HJ57_9LILI|nr:hypothetical protein J5N97_013865 [Dioscorea zingiberensis]